MYHFQGGWIIPAGPNNSVTDYGFCSKLGNARSSWFSYDVSSWVLETVECLQEHVANHNKWDNPKSPSKDTNNIPWNAYVVWFCSMKINIYDALRRGLTLTWSHFTYFHLHLHILWICFVSKVQLKEIHPIYGYVTPSTIVLVPDVLESAHSGDN